MSVGEGSTRLASPFAKGRYSVVMLGTISAISTLLRATLAIESLARSAYLLVNSKVTWNSNRMCYVADAVFDDATVVTLLLWKIRI